MQKEITNFIYSPVLALSFSSLFWAGNFTVGRALREDIQPVPLNYWRWFIAALILLPLSVNTMKHHMPLLIKQWKLLLILSLTGIVGFHICVYQALQTTTAINALLFLSVCPLMILIGTRMAFRERIWFVQGVGVVISLSGVITLLLHGELQRLLLLQFNSGDLWMLIAIILWSIYSVLLKTKPGEMPQQTLLVAIVLLGVIIMTPIYLLSDSGSVSSLLSTQVLMGLLYIGLFASVLAYFFWNYGVSKLGPNRAGSYLHLMPLFGAVLSIVFLGEWLDIYHIVGAALIAIGIILSHRQSV